MPDDRSNPLVVSLAAIVGLVLIWSAVKPHDYFTWFLEVLPALIGLAVLAGTRRRFPLTPLLYTLIAMHMCILMVGGHYTYAQVPLFNWIRDAFGLARNHYDRLGHLAQGFVPAMVARELLRRTSPLGEGKWLFTLATCAALAMSALYELFEWAMAVATGEAATAFLGTQGDVWDTQWDMFCALIGALAAQLLLARLHRRQLERFLPPTYSSAAAR